MRPALCQRNKFSCLLPICKKNALYKKTNPRNLTLLKCKGVGTSRLEQLLDSPCFSLFFSSDIAEELFWTWHVLLRKPVQKSSRICSLTWGGGKQNRCALIDKILNQGFCDLLFYHNLFIFGVGTVWKLGPCCAKSHINSYERSPHLEGETDMEEAGRYQVT